MNDLGIISQWVTAARAGDEAAWGNLYEYYRPGLTAAALKICNNTETAMDAVQEAFITAWLKLVQLKEAAAFGGWMKKIVMHYCYRATRANKLIVYTGDACFKEDHWEDEINRKSEWLAKQDRMYASLSQLPEILSTTVLLRYFSNFHTYEDIARILCIPIGTVRSRLNQARLKLAEHWQQSHNADMAAFKQGEEWNHFYRATLSAMHRHDNDKNRFLCHLQKDIRIGFPNGKQDNGRIHFENIVIDDRAFGSWLTPVNIISCGNISIIESRHYNSKEHPDHCPPGSLIVLHRDKKVANKMSLHFQQ